MNAIQRGICELFEELSDLSRRYDRHVLLHNEALWQTRLHWIAPASFGLSVLIAAVVFVLMHVAPDWGVPPVEQLVYPLFVASFWGLMLWLYSQSGAIVPFEGHAHRLIFRLLLLRLACVAAVLLPTMVLSLSLYAYIDNASKDIRIQPAIAAVAKAARRCVDGPLRDEPPAASNFIRVPEGSEDNLKLMRVLAATGVRLTGGNTFALGGRAEESAWIVQHCALMTKARSGTSPELDNHWNETPEQLVDTVRMMLYLSEFEFPPRRMPRSFLYIISCMCLLLPSLAIWAGYRRIIIVAAIWAAFAYVLTSLSALGAFQSVSTIFNVLARCVIAVCSLTLVAWPLALRPGASPRKYLLAFMGPVVVAPLLPMAVLRVSSKPFMEGTGEPQFDETEIFARLFSEVWPIWTDTFDRSEHWVYAGGLAYCCLYLLLVGPTMHRLWASPR